MGVAFGLASVYYLKHNGIVSKIFALLSSGIKYITLPLLLIFDNTKSVVVSFIAMSVIMIYLCSKQGIQPWYFTSFFVFLPFYRKLFIKTSLISFGLLASYFPYISYGGFNKPEWIGQKNMIIYVSFLLTLLIYLTPLLKKSLKIFNSR
jgi:hypothetical protein